MSPDVSDLEWVINGTALCKKLNDCWLGKKITLAPSAALVCDAVYPASKQRDSSKRDYVIRPLSKRTGQLPNARTHNY